MELTIDQALQKAVEAHRAGQIQDADLYYTAILKVEPNHPDANHNLGVLAVGVGKIQEALPLLKTALDANPSVAQFWLSYINALTKLGRNADAKAVLDQAKSKGAEGDGFDKLEQLLNEADGQARKLATEALPTQTNILDNLKLDRVISLAKQKEKDGAPEEAKRIYQDVLLKFPKNKRAKDGLKGLACSSNDNIYKIQDPSQDQVHSLINLYNLRQLEQAINQVNTLLKQFPKSAILLNIKGAVLKGLGQLALSIEAYKKALAIKPDYADAYYNMGNALQEQGKLKEALEAYKKTLTIKPDYAKAYYNMGNALKEQGKMEEALEAYKKTLTIKPDYADAYNNMGATLKEQGKLEEALEAYKKTLTIKPDYAEAYYNMGVTLKEQGKLEEAIVVYKKALTIKPDYAEAHYNTGITLQEQGKLEEALVFYKKALTSKPDYAEAYNNMGVILQEQGKMEEATQAFKKALTIKPDYAEAYNNMGVTLRQHGEMEEDIQAFKKALTIKPDYAEAHRNLSNVTNYKSETAQISEVKSLLKRIDLSDPDRCHLLYTYAKMQEDLGDLRSAFESYVAGGSLRQKLLRYEFTQDEHLFGRIKQTAQHFKDLTLDVTGELIRPIPIFILGMPRSGTTLVEQIISSHSEVTGAGELDYVEQFGGQLAAGTKAPRLGDLAVFRNRYLARLAKRADGQTFLTDKMPQNFIYIALICAAFPEAKIIHVQRNSKATCWSNFKHYFASKGLGYSYNLGDTVRYHRLYKDLMHFWDQSYNDRIYSLDYDELTENQEPETRRVIDYLGLNWEDACLAPQENKRSVKTASSQQVRQKVYTGSSQTWRKYAPFLDGIFDQLET
jgi:tetratricopeptide (TPR) repeat protein